MRPMRALLLGGVGLLLQGLVLLPFFDDHVDSNPALHYLQHGLVFAGGICMGIALRDLLLANRRV